MAADIILLVFCAAVAGASIHWWFATSKFVTIRVPAAIAKRVQLITVRIYLHWVIANVAGREFRSTAHAIRHLAELVSDSEINVEFFTLFNGLANVAKHAGFTDPGFDPACPPRRPERHKKHIDLDRAPPYGLGGDIRGISPSLYPHTPASKYGSAVWWNAKPRFENSTFRKTRRN